MDDNKELFPTSFNKMVYVITDLLIIISKDQYFKQDILRDKQMSKTE